MQRAILLAALITLITLAGTAVAHHSGAMFDRSKVIVLEGTLIEYRFVAPHSWLSVMAQVNGKGEKVRWDVESATASRMKQQGVTPQNLKPGDKIKMVVNPLRDGRKGASLIELTLADGTRMRNDTTKLKVGQ
jgi:hypothetical protein